MSSARAAQHRLAAAVQSVRLPELTTVGFDRPVEPAQTRQNLPQPAIAPPAQNEATSNSPTRTILHRLLAAASDSDERALLLACENALEPAQTCHNLPEPAETCRPPIAPAQNEARSPAPLTPRQRHAARLLVAGDTVKSVAARLGVNPHTVSQWKKHPTFQAEIQRVLERPAPTPNYFPAG
jgi:DNA-binding CsgD family transcriptional regulator